MSCWGVKRCLSLITLSDVEEMVDVVQVKLAEDCGPLEQLKSRGDDSKRRLILNECPY